MSGVKEVWVGDGGLRVSYLTHPHGPTEVMPKPSTEPCLKTLQVATALAT